MLISSSECCTPPVSFFYQYDILFSLSLFFFLVLFHKIIFAFSVSCSAYFLNFFFLLDTLVLGFVMLSPLLLTIQVVRYAYVFARSSILDYILVENSGYSSLSECMCLDLWLFFFFFFFLLFF